VQQVGYDPFLEQYYYELHICLTRHGEKTGDDGNLSSEAEQNASDYFSDAYRGYEDDFETTRIVSSPVERVVQTANSLKRAEHIKSKVEINSKLSEGNVMDFYNSLDESKRENWLNYWVDADERPRPEIMIGKEAAARISAWLIDELHEAKEKGGVEDVYAFSHATSMAALILGIEEKMGIHIFPRKTEDGSISRKEITDGWTGFLHFLSNINISANSENPQMVNFNCFRISVDVPIDIIEQIANFKIDEKKEENE